MIPEKSSQTIREGVHITPHFTADTKHAETAFLLDVCNGVERCKNMDTRLHSFVDDLDLETGQITQVKVLF